MQGFEEFEVISKYTKEQAIEDGYLIPVGSFGKFQVLFTSNLFKEGYEDKQKRVKLVRHGIELLRKHDEQDSKYMKLRIIEKDRIWVVWNTEAITFMKPEDY